MIAQRVIFCDAVCAEKEFFFRANNKAVAEEVKISMSGKCNLSTETYMNIFDCATWEKYTGIKNWKFCFSAKGQGHVTLKQWDEAGTIVIGEWAVDTLEDKEYEIAFSSTDKGYLFFDCETDTELVLHDCNYQTNKVFEWKSIHLAVIICTYKRNKEVLRNVETLINSRFFQGRDELQGRMSIYVVDNGAELPPFKTENMYLLHNANTGGSGGFSRGMEEVRKQEQKYGITSVVLMDDDVEFMTESFYRLYALLNLVREKYRKEVIAGRMFRLDKRKIQYTAVEIWNGGDIEHCGFQLDVTERESLAAINQNEKAEYSGWWFACYPMEFIRENVPEQYFLHCDDVEYGLRHGGTPIIMNGIQVWHETYEYRQSPTIAYYDVRNRMAVNKKYGILSEQFCREFIIQWKKAITDAHVAQDYLREYMIIIGLRDFLARRYQCTAASSGRHHKKLIKTKTSRYKNAVMWRIVNYMYTVKYLKFEKRNHY